MEVCEKLLINHLIINIKDNYLTTKINNINVNTLFQFVSSFTIMKVIATSRYVPCLSLFKCFYDTFPPILLKAILKQELFVSSPQTN